VPATSVTTHNGRTMTFREADHSYTDDQGHQYTSVTTMIGEFFPKFDADATAKRMEAQGKGTAAELKASWVAAGEYGTRCHETAEALLQQLPPPHKPASPREKGAFTSIWEYCTGTLLENMTLVGAEILVFAPKFYVAGTIDLAMRTPSGTLWILDWKTNKALKTVGYKGAMGMGPCRCLPDANVSKYALQLSIYERILRDASYIPPDTIVKRGLLWVKPGEPVSLIPTPYLAVEVADVLLAHFTDVPF
jgi:ATP-dependent exoDNAse (exonuclease V) beta subunit